MNSVGCACVYFGACCCLPCHVHKHTLHPVCTNFIILRYFNGETKQKNYFSSFLLNENERKIFSFALGLFYIIVILSLFGWC